MSKWEDPKVRNSFYASKAWRDLRSYKLSINPTCQICSTEEHPVMAAEVHHLEEVKDNPARRLDMRILQSLCKSCHSKITYQTSLPGTAAKALDLQILNKKWDTSYLLEKKKPEENSSIRKRPNVGDT